MTLADAIRQTEAAAWAYSKASRAAKVPGWWNSDEAKALSDACKLQVGRVTVSAATGGNSRRQHVRHTFKIDGKRATREAAIAAS